MVNARLRQVALLSAALGSAIQADEGFFGPILEYGRRLSRVDAGQLSADGLEDLWFVVERVDSFFAKYRASPGSSYLEPTAIVASSEDLAELRVLVGQLRDLDPTALDAMREGPVAVPARIETVVERVGGDALPVGAKPPDLEVTDALEASRLFHRVHRLIPEGQELDIVSPDTPVVDALELMLRNDYSQLPVVARGHVLGSITFRSFARGVLELQGQRTDPLALSVDDFVEKLEIVHPTAELASILDPLDHDGAVIVGQPDQLDGLVAAVDALRYLYGVAALFVQLEEIEHALREVIRRSVTETELMDCINRSLSTLYKGREDKMPTTALGLSFGEYAAVVCDGRNWQNFESILGGDRARTKARLDRAADLRNDVLHFRRDLTAEDRAHLASTREWLLRRVQLADLEGQSDE